MKKILSPLYVQVFLAIVLGALLGHFYPDFGPSLQPLGLAFIRLVKMLIGPIIFTTVVAGIGSVGDLKAVGRVGIKALVYFEGMTTFALLLGMVVINLVRPGVGIHATAATLGASGTVPVAGIALILGVDTFMSQARAITNFIGNAVATLVVSRWEDAIDPVAARCVLVSPPELPAVQPAV